MGSLMVSLDADDFILLCSITVKHAPAASRTATTVAGIWLKYACRMLIA